MPSELPQSNSPDSCFEQLWLTQTGLLGRGTTRTVYTLRDWSDVVLKVSCTPSNFTNWAEIVAYHFNNESNALARVVTWSWSGKFLVMEKLTPLEKGALDRYRFPDFLTDRKLENYGRDKEGNIKALDFGSLKFTQSTFGEFV